MTKISMMSEFTLFLRQNKKLWLLPMVIVLMLRALWAQAVLKRACRQAKQSASDQTTTAYVEELRRCRARRDRA